MLGWCQHCLTIHQSAASAAGPDAVAVAAAACCYYYSCLAGDGWGQVVVMTLSESDWCCVDTDADELVT